MMRLFKLGLSFFSSLKLTVVCLAMMMILVFFTTLAQVDVGIFEAKRQFFSGIFVWKSLFGHSIPVFLSGISVGWLLFINLIAAHLSRFKLAWSKLGIWMIHGGLIVLLIGAACTYYLADETQMILPEGQSSIYSESTRKLEVVLIREVNGRHQVVAIPYELLKRDCPIELSQVGVTVIPRQIFNNSQLLTMSPTGNLDGFIGIARHIRSIEIPLFKQDDIQNIATVYFEVIEGTVPKGVFLLSNGLSVYQSLHVNSGEWFVRLRSQREYHSYQITLNEFRHDVYTGTQIPKNFSSQVTVTDLKTGQSFQSLIYMNHPLRHEGKTYYQASFADNDTTSILQVVRNPSWIFPYVASIMIGLGLLFQFGYHLIRSRK